MVDNKLSQQCELCGELSSTQIYITLNDTLPCCYLRCSVCEVEYLTNKESSINKYVKKMEVKDGNIFH